MATPTFDLSGLVLLENTISAMQAAAPSSFVGGTPFNAKFSAVPGASTGTTPMTTAQLQGRLNALMANFNLLPL